MCTIQFSTVSSHHSDSTVRYVATKCWKQMQRLSLYLSCRRYVLDSADRILRAIVISLILVAPARSVQAHLTRTSCPIFLHQSIISGMACSFSLRPDFLMASMTAKLLCNVLSDATASFTSEVSEWYIWSAFGTYRIRSRHCSNCCRKAALIWRLSRCQKLPEDAHM
jgi:hypothetical protein